MKELPSVSKQVAGFTLIELLVVISIIAILASLAIPAVTSALVKSQISKTASNYRQLYVLTQSASLDSQSAGGQGAFPGDVSNSVANWSNALVPAYCSASSFHNLGVAKGQETNTQVWNVKITDEPITIFISTVGFSGNTTNLTFDTNGPFGANGGAFVTVQGQAFTIVDTNSPSLTNGSAMISSNGFNLF